MYTQPQDVVSDAPRPSHMAVPGRDGRILLFNAGRKEFWQLPLTAKGIVTSQQGGKIGDVFLDGALRAYTVAVGLERGELVTSDDVVSRVCVSGRTRTHVSPRVFVCRPNHSARCPSFRRRTWRTFADAITSSKGPTSPRARIGMCPPRKLKLTLTSRTIPPCA